MQVIISRNSPRPVELVEGTTVCIIRDDIRAETVTDEDGNVSIEHICTEYRLSPAEYALLKNGICDEWTKALHEVYRMELHRRTDDLYAMAERNIRSGADEEAWSIYTAALDSWNIAVSAMAEGFSTSVPALPEPPA